MSFQSKLRVRPGVAQQVPVIMRPTVFLLLLLSAQLPTSAALGQSEQQIRRWQDMLIWTTDYEGLIDGKIGPETIKAINKFQERLKNPQTGRLTAAEEEDLRREGSRNKAEFGFEQITDTLAGVSVGLPRKLVSGPSTTKWGKHWYGRTAGLAIDTLRFGGDVNLRQLYDRLIRINNRVIPYSRIVEDDWFVIAGFEGQAHVYVKAKLVPAANQQSEIRGFSVWMSKDRPMSYQAIAPAMASSFRWSDNVASSPPRPTPNPSIGGNFRPAPSVPQTPPPAVAPIRTDGPAPDAGNCFRGLGRGCPKETTEVLTFR
jgi:hypothetical protein